MCMQRLVSVSPLSEKQFLPLFLSPVLHILPHLLCTALSWAVQYRPVCIAQSIPVSSTVYLNDKFPCLNASIVFLVSDVAVVLGPWCVVHRSTWQVNEELGGPAKIRDGASWGFDNYCSVVTALPPALMRYQGSVSIRAVVDWERVMLGSDVVMWPSSFPSQQLLQLCWHLLLGYDLNVLTPWPFT